MSERILVAIQLQKTASARFPQFTTDPNLLIVTSSLGVIVVKEAVNAAGSISCVTRRLDGKKKKRARRRLVTQQHRQQPLQDELRRHSLLIG